jgi:hypothetical protein
MTPTMADLPRKRKEVSSHYQTLLSEVLRSIQDFRITLLEQLISSLIQITRKTFFNEVHMVFQFKKTNSLVTFVCKVDGTNK